MAVVIHVAERHARAIQVNLVGKRALLAERIGERQTGVPWRHSLKTAFARRND